MTMLEGKTAVIYGAGGAIGGAAAEAFAAAGARVYLVGRSQDRLDAVAGRIRAPSGVHEVDAFDADAVAAHFAMVVAEAGVIDITLNAVAVPFVHGVPFTEASVDDVMHPVTSFLRTNLITAHAAARHMAERGSGTILTLSTAASRFVSPGTLGYGTAGTLVEVVSKRLAVELGPRGVRVVCLRPHALADGAALGSFAVAAFESRAAAVGLTVDDWLVEFAKDAAVLGRFPTAAEIADAAVFVASDRARAITGSVVDLSCGNAVRTAGGVLARSLD